MYSENVGHSWKGRFRDKFKPPLVDYEDLLSHIDKWIGGVVLHTEALEDLFLPLDQRRGMLKSVKSKVRCLLSYGFL